MTLLFRVPSCVTTLTLPVVAPLGTVAVISELDKTLKAAAVPLNVTLVAPAKFAPRILTAVRTLPEVGCVSSWPTDLVVLSWVREDCVRFRLAGHIFAFQPDMHRCNLSP